MMLFHRPRLLLLFGLPLVLGCGGLGAPPGSPGTTGGSANGTGGTSVGGSATGGTAASGGAGAGGAAECFAPGAPNLISVVVTNYTGESIYIGQNSVTCEEAPLFKVFRDNGAELLPPGRCDHLCGRQVGCTAICLYPSAFALAPNESAKLLYDATDYVQAVQPSTCEDAGECQRGINLEAGYYAFMAAAGTYADCTDTTSTCGACEPADSGGCTIPAALVPLYSYAAKANVWLDPASGTSEDVFLDFYGPTNAPD